MKTLNLLIVDDEPVIQQGLSNIIDWESYGIKPAGFACNGLEALAFMQAHQNIDIVLTDIRMPHCDGLTFIEKATVEFPNTKFIVLSGFEDFDYAKRAISLRVTGYLLKPIVIQELIDTLHQIRCSLDLIDEKPVPRHEYFRQLILTPILSPGALDTLNSKLDIAYPCTVNVFDLPHTNAPILELLTNAFTATHCEFFHCENRFLGVLTYGTSVAEQKQLLLKICSYMEKNFQIYGRFGMGTLCNELSELKPSYINAKNYLSYKIYDQKSLFFNFTIMGDTTISPPSIDSQLSNDIKVAILNKNTEKLTSLTDKFFHQLLYIKMPPPAYIYGMCNHLIIEVCNTFIEYPIVKDSITIGELYSDLLTQESLDDIKRYVHSTFLHISMLLNGTFTKSKNPMIDSALIYIEANIASKLTLDDVAKHVCLNKNYFTTLFTRMVGESFRNYLITQKMEYAKKILQSEDISITALAVNLGYDEPRSFIRAFKKSTGKTPFEYASTYNYLK